MKTLSFLTAIVMALQTCSKSQMSEKDITSFINITVSQNGDGDVISVQEAINLAPEFSADRFLIYIKNGIYKEKVLLPQSKSNITLIGENADSVIISYDDFSGKVVNGETITTNTSHTFSAEGDDFMAMNITFENSAGPVGQAVALKTTGDRQIYYNCRLIGHQDTYYTQGHSRNYLKNCFIEGTTDYIFGRATVVFDSCHINSLKTGSFITAASTEQYVKYGYVFFHCTFTAATGIEKVFLGRPWRPYAQTVIIHSFLDHFVNPQGWSIWSGNENHLTAYYAEYQNFGPGATSENRIEWSHQLNDSEADKYTIKNIFAKEVNPDNFSNDWYPDLENDPVYQLVKKQTGK